MITASAVLVAIVGGLLLLAAWIDLTTYRIPNWIPLAVLGLFPLFAAAAGLTFGAVLWHGVAFAATLAVGFALFAWNKLGGGDVKLLAAVALWAGWGAPLVDLLVVTTILGGALSLAILLCRGSAIGVSVGTLLRAHGWNIALFDPGQKVAPYGVAICGAFLVLNLAPG